MNTLKVSLGVIFFLPIALLADTPSSSEEVAECLFFVQTYSSNGDPLGRGSAFVAEDSGVQWLFTNAHVIENAARIEFRDKNGALITDLGRFQCYSRRSGLGSHGKKNENKFGSDGVRIELKKPRRLSLSISTRPERFIKGVKVITFGDNGGDRKLDILEGEVTASSNSIIQSTCKTQPGCSGGALIDPETFEVIGLHTFGIDGNIKLMDAIWQQEVDGKVAGASILNEAKWIDMKVGDFLKGSEIAMNFRDSVRMLALIYTLVPQEGGFKIELSNNFAANITFEQALNMYSNDLVIKPVFDLNKRMKQYGGNIGINNMELVRTYAVALARIRELYARQKAIPKTKLAPYYQINFEQS